MRESRRTPLVLAALASLSGCRSNAVTVVFEDNQEHSFARAERRAIEEVAEQAVADARRVLPQLPGTILVTVRASKDVIPETGENASNGQPNLVFWRVDASRKSGVAAVAHSQLRPSLFHELHHVVRAASVLDSRLRDHVVREGLATAFERDFAHVAVPWGEYPPEISLWTDEIMRLPDDAPREQWLFKHPDGRRWIGLRVGTYLADRAMRASGKSSAELVNVPTDAVLTMGLAAPRP